MSYTTEQPIQYTPDPSKFGTLAGGKVWFGIPNGNPASVPTDRIQVYLARQGLSDLPIAQPIDIGPGGVWMYNGSPAQIKVLVPYCVQIMNSLGVQKFYSPAAGDEITKFNSLDAEQVAQNVEIAKAVKTVATFADISSALSALSIGQQFSLSCHTFPGLGGGIFNVVSSSGLVTDTGTVVVNGAKAALRSTSTALNVLYFGADPTGVSDSTAAFQAAINTGQTVFVPEGTYSVVSLDFRQKYPHFIGDSMTTTFIKARSSSTSLINAAETIDGQVTPLFISNLTLDGNNLVSRIIDMRFRHMSNLENLYIINATSAGSNGLFAVDCWLNSLNNCRFTNLYNGLNLYGSNHRSTVNSCSFTACNNTGISCNSLGTALDGNNALVFNNCDVEFGNGLGAYLNVSDAVFNGCYMGENLGGPAFFVDSGNILVTGGVTYFGHTANSFGVTGGGGRVLFDKVSINGQTFSGITTLMSGGLLNYYKFQNCGFGIGLGGNPIMSGDRLDYGPPAVVFAQRLGKNYTPSYNNATGSITTTSKGQRVTCATAPGPTPIIGLQCSLINPDQAIVGEKLYLVLVYKLETASGSSEIRLSGSPLGGSPSVVLGTPPDSTTVATYFKLDTAFPSGAFTVFEFQIVNCGVGDYLEIQECFLADNRMLQQIAGVTEMANLYKC